MKKKYNIILSIIAVVIIIAVGIWYYFYWQGENYFTTEDSKVTTNLYSIVPSAAGKLVRLNVSEGSFVNQNDVIARVENGPYVRSPINGQVVKCNVTLNQVLAATSVVAVIADTDNVYINANIEETNIMKIKEGQQVIVKLDAYPGKTFNGHVEEVGKVTENSISGTASSFSTSGTFTKVTQLIPVKIMIDEDVALNELIGTNATVKIKLK